MAIRFLYRVQETTTGTGTGALNLGGAATKMLSFSGAGFSDGDTFWGLIEHATASEWEIALCTYHAGAPGNITRATPIKSSTGSAVSFSAGTKSISLIQMAGSALEAVSSPAISAGTLTLDVSAAQNFTVALNANVSTLTIANMLAGYASGFTLELTADGTPRTFAMPGNVTALNGAYTPSSTNGKRDMLAFWTNDGGTTWRSMIVAQNY